MEIRINDTVVVLSGDDSGTRGRVLRVDRKGGKVVVEGVNTVHKHVRPSQRNPKGGRLRKEMPIQMSNVMLVCPSCNASSRTGVRLNEDGAKYRYCKKCGASVSQISPAKKVKA
jgi:large subunit ribosomal protein L24